MPLLRTVAFSYRSRDRILAAVNIGQAEAWSCWITRLLALAMIEGAAKFLASSVAPSKACAPNRNFGLWDVAGLVVFSKVKTLTDR